MCTPELFGSSGLESESSSKGTYHQGKAGAAHPSIMVMMCSECRLLEKALCLSVDKVDLLTVPSTSGSPWTMPPLGPYFT